MRVLRVSIVGMVFLAGAPGVLDRGELFALQAAQQTSQEQPVRTETNDRQKKLAEDTDKLLVLATELKQRVDKTNKDVLSVDVIKKADEIEKLARSLKERLKN
jgi:uncharacterized protein YlxW (UPF0749 family)